MSAAGVAAWLSSVGLDTQQDEVVSLCSPELAPLWTFVLSGGLQVDGKDHAAESHSARGALKREGRQVTAAEPAQDAVRELDSVQATARLLSESEQESATSAAEAQLKVYLYNSYLAARSQLMEVLCVYCSSIEDEIAKANSMFAKAQPESRDEAGKEFVGAIETELKRQICRIMSAGNLSSAELSWDDAKQAAKLALSEADNQGCPPGLVQACIEHSGAALQEITAAIKNVNLAKDAEDLSRLPAFKEYGVLDSEQLLHAARQEHVQTFSKTIVAGEASREAKSKLENLQANLNRLCQGSQAGTHRKRLLMLISDIAGNREAVRILELEMALLKKQKVQQAAMEQALQQTREEVVKTRMRNVMLDAIVNSLVTSAAGFLASWAPNVTSNKANLYNSLQPHAAILAACAQNAAAKLADESFAVAQAPLHLLGIQKAAGEDWGQRTVAQQTKEAKHLMQQLAGLEKGLALLREAKELANLSPAAKLGAAYAAFMQRVTTRTDEIQALESSGRQALLRGQTVVMEVLQEWWDQPAINAVDWIKLEGRSAKEWLLHMRTLHAALHVSDAC